MGFVDPVGVPPGPVDGAQRRRLHSPRDAEVWAAVLRFGKYAARRRAVDAAGIMTGLSRKMVPNSETGVFCSELKLRISLVLWEREKDKFGG